jgi:hypothetical protein
MEDACTSLGLLKSAAASNELLLLSAPFLPSLVAAAALLPSSLKIERCCCGASTRETEECGSRDKRRQAQMAAVRSSDDVKMSGNRMMEGERYWTMHEKQRHHAEADYNRCYLPRGGLLL